MELFTKGHPAWSSIIVAVAGCADAVALEESTLGFMLV